MADEEENKEETQVEGGEEKAGGIGGLLQSKLALPLVAVLGAAIGGGGAFFLAGGGDPPPAEEGEASTAEGGAQGDESKGVPDAPNLEDEAEKLAKADYAQEKATTAAEEQAGGDALPPGTQLIKFDPLVVNIFEKNSIHYLKLQLELAVSSEEVIAEIETEKARLRDRLLFIFSDTTLREVLSTGGKALLKEDIQIAFNKILTKGKVNQIYFTDFTVQ